MRVTTITVGRTYNTGNYTSRRFEVTAALDYDDDFDHAIVELSDDLDRMAAHVLAMADTQKEEARGRDFAH